MKQTILVVVDIRELVSIFLKKSGYDVIEAADGEKAKEGITCETG
ncbi:hypothetical protein ACFQ3N_08540 [Virgibacillus byunsanensis]|uniref:Response regulatory domain-containing protein n=1 Tax=Virgibacillus byunsanensis TaxID=570945 RepID=A0ABW3LLX7_9BACI